MAPSTGGSTSFLPGCDILFSAGMLVHGPPFLSLCTMLTFWAIPFELVEEGIPVCVRSALAATAPLKARHVTLLPVTA